jgi:hypothetical protein
LQLAVVDSYALLTLAQFENATDVALQGLGITRQTGLEGWFHSTILAASVAEALLARGRTADAAAVIDPVSGNDAKSRSRSAYSRGWAPVGHEVVHPEKLVNVRGTLGYETASQSGMWRVYFSAMLPPLAVQAAVMQRRPAVRTPNGSRPRNVAVVLADVIGRAVRTSGLGGGHG